MNKQLQKPATTPVSQQPPFQGAPLDTPKHIAGEATDGTPLGAGRDYDPAASGSGNAHGKASATRAGGDPVSSPVIGNPGEARRDIGYDYGLAGASAAQPLGNPRAASQPLSSVPMFVQVKQEPVEEDTTEYAERVRARQKGHYNGLREVGDIFENVNNLKTYPEDPNSWFEDAEKDPHQEMPVRQRLRQSKQGKK